MKPFREMIFGVQSVIVEETLDLYKLVGDSRNGFSVVPAMVIGIEMSADGEKAICRVFQAFGNAPSILVCINIEILGRHVDSESRNYNETPGIKVCFKRRRVGNGVQLKQSFGINRIILREFNCHVHR
jgi:hypothetical protein